LIFTTVFIAKMFGRRAHAAKNGKNFATVQLTDHSGV